MGTSKSPVDVGTTGHGAPPPSPPVSPQTPPAPTPISDFAIGTAEGFGHAFFDTAKASVLSALTFGGYTTYSIWKSVYDGYKEDGLVGALNGPNPIHALLRDAADASLAADNGDYRTVGRAVGRVVFLVAAAAVSSKVGRAVEARNAAAGKLGPVRNAHLAGKAHPATGVPFDTNGFPDFRAAGVVQVEVKIAQTGTRHGDFVAANRAGGLSETPKGMTWHHHQDGTTMQLVPRRIHEATGHTGGFSLGGE